jgi:hypothetical protein
VNPRNRVVVRLHAPIEPARARVICQRVAQLMAQQDGELSCHVEGLVDLGLVDTLLRLHVLARRHDRRMTVHAAGPELSELLRLTGLDRALPEVTRAAYSRSGTPNRANSAGSRKWCTWEICPSDSSSTWMHQGSWPPPEEGL